MDYVKIPQNIRVEDKLVGPLSLRQIFIIAIGGGTSYALYGMVQKSFGTVPTFAHAIIWWPLIILASIAVVKINDISLTRYLLLILESSLKPKIRVWQPRKGIYALPEKITQKKKKKKNTETEEKPESKSSVHLEELSIILDQEGDKQGDDSELSIQQVEQAMNTPQHSTS